MDRTEMQPALLKAAEAICIYRDTDGFCHPRNHQGCECWQKAESVMRATGLSANAVSWIVQYSERVERLSKEDSDGG